MPRMRHLRRALSRASGEEEQRVGFGDLLQRRQHHDGKAQHASGGCGAVLVDADGAAERVGGSLGPTGRQPPWLPRAAVVRAPDGQRRDACGGERRVTRHHAHV